jgi:hypothetical protein
MHTGDRVTRCLEHNVSVMVGSVDASGEPSTCRAMAIRSTDGFETLTVYVPVATSKETIANVATTRKLTVVATHPIDHHSLQFKGIAGTARLAREDEAPLVRKGFDGFAGLLNTIGIPPRVTNAVTRWPAFAIEMRVAEIFDQTPGPKAGTRLR